MWRAYVPPSVNRRSGLRGQEDSRCPWMKQSLSPSNQKKWIAQQIMAEQNRLEAPFEVYLVDPGVRASHVITLVQEVTHLDTAASATLVHDAPSRIAGFSSRVAAENL